jgi:hypothetical protein
MVHILVTIMYALNVLSRYGNKPDPRHIIFFKRLLFLCHISLIMAPMISPNFNSDATLILVAT